MVINRRFVPKENTGLNEQGKDAKVVNLTKNFRYKKKHLLLPTVIRKMILAINGIEV